MPDATGGPLLRVENLSMHFPGSRRRGAPVRAVDDICFTVAAGETLGLVGESGCGKSTTGRAVLQLHRPTAGKVWLGDIDLTTLDERELRGIRPRLQMIFQDSYASLNPRHSVGRIVAEPLRVHRQASRTGGTRRVQELLDLVGLPESAAARFPHEFSGGQRQRINIARALALNPDLVVCDEPISALDVSIQAQVVNLLSDLQAEFGLAYLFIAHDLSMVEHIAHRIAVMYLGHLVEMAANDDIFARPAHPYTQALLSAVPVPDPRREAARRRVKLVGEVSSASSMPTGCVFVSRCPHAEAICREERPALRPVAPGHAVACHLAPTQSATADSATTM